jgi:DNA polymerase-3 subunit beta
LKGNSLKITASDSETTLLCNFDINECDTDCRFAINAKNILDALKEIPEQPISFNVDLDNLNIIINYQNGHYNTMGQNADEYPSYAPLSDSAASLPISADSLLTGINRTIFASADDELRPVMTGVYFDITTESLTIVASDGHKLVRNRLLKVKGEKDASFILPKKPANILKTLLAKQQGDVTISFDERNSVITMENYTMVCRLIEGRYPNYNSVIPQDNPNHVTVDRASMLSAMRRVLVFSSQSTALVKLQVEPNQITISGQDIDFSTSAEEHLTCQYDGMPMNIGFKGTFLIDILNNIGGNDIILELADPSRAGVIIPAEQSDDEEVLMLLMPMMLND